MKAISRRLRRLEERLVPRKVGLPDLAAILRERFRRPMEQSGQAACASAGAFQTPLRARDNCIGVGALSRHAGRSGTAGMFPARRVPPSQAAAWAMRRATTVLGLSTFGASRPRSRQPESGSGPQRRQLPVPASRCGPCAPAAAPRECSRRAVYRRATSRRGQKLFSLTRARMPRRMIGCILAENREP